MIEESLLHLQHILEIKTNHINRIYNAQNCLIALKLEFLMYLYS